MIIYFCRARNRNRTMKKILDFKTVCECNRNLGCKTWHPQVSIINLENLNLKQEAVKFDFYTILLIEECPNSCCCGRKYYDFSNTTMVFLMPGEIFRMSEENTLPDKGYLLAFHPNLLSQTSLKSHIQNYTFFQYRKEEAPHLSQRESTHTATPSSQNTLSSFWTIAHATTNVSSLQGKTKTRLF